MEAAVLNSVYTHYGLARKPFNMTPDPAFLFLSKQHREALAGLMYAILDRKGFLVLSGVAGCGKTTLLAWVLQKLPAERVQSSIIFNPTLTREEFLEMAMLNLGIKDIPASKAQRLLRLQEHLLNSKKGGKVCALIVDEAHKLTPELLEEIRLLGNFELPDEKLLQILLIGQRELDEKLSQPDLWQLKQRVSVRLTIEPLCSDEVEPYIQHRWRVAGGAEKAPFSPDAIACLMKLSKRIPRLINSLSENALLLGIAEGVDMLRAAHIDAAARDLGLLEKAPGPQLVPAGTTASTESSLPAPPVIRFLPPQSKNGTSGRKQSFVARWMGIGRNHN